MADNGPLHSLRLPPEILGKIICLLPHADKRTVLSVSRQFYVHAVRLLFSVIYLHFGTWKVYNGNHRRQDHDDEYRNFARSWDILEHISATSDFGNLVKKIVVRAFRLTDLVFECRTLIKAFRHIPNLVSFHWTSVCTQVPAEVMTGLATFCPGLRELRVPSFTGLKTSDTCHLKNLQSFHCLPEWNIWRLTFYPNECYPEFAIPDSILSIMDDNFTTLKSVSLFGNHTNDLSIQSFLNLFELTIWEVHGNAGFILRDACQLRSLFLHALDDEELGSIFENYIIHLPKLSACALLAEHSRSMTRWHGVPSFLHRHRGLQRLFLDISLPSDFILECASIFQEMPQLNTLGLCLLECRPYLIGAIWCSIPKRICALSIHMPRSPLKSSQLAFMAGQLATLPSLLFLHILTTDPWDDKPHDTDYMSLARALKHLRFLGVDEKMSTITRTGSGSSDITIKIWSREFLLRSKDDFEGFEEAEWLMRVVDFRDNYGNHNSNDGTDDEGSNDQGTQEEEETSESEIGGGDH